MFDFQNEYQGQFNNVFFKKNLEFTEILKKSKKINNNLIIKEYLAIN